MMKKIIGSILCLSLIVSLLCQTSLAADDTVKLTGSKTVDATIVIETNTVYDLNGYTLARAAGTSGSVFYIKGGATLQVMDSSAAKTGKITGGKALAGSSFEASELGFNRGEYRDFTDGCGGGAYVESGAKLVMTGGSITGNRAEQGGGVYLESGAELHVSGAASVTGNYYGASGTTPDNVFLPLNGSNQQSAIAVDATLTAAARIGITPAARGSAGENAALTSGLRGKGVKENFTADEAGKSVSTNTAGEIIFTSPQQGGQSDDNTTGGLSGNSGDNTSAAGTGSGDNGSVALDVSVSGTTAAVKAPGTEELNKAIGAAGKTGAVTFDLSGLNKTVDAVSLPTETVKAVEKAVSDPTNGANVLTVKLTSGSATFDAGALAEIAGQAKGGTIRLALVSVAESSMNTAQQSAIKDMDVQAVFDIQLTSSETSISDFKGGAAKVTIPYALKSGQYAAGLTVRYLADNGTVQAMPTSYDGRNVSFTTGHLSNYAIVYDASKVKGTDMYAQMKDLGSNAWYRDGVLWALENGVMNGVSPQSFGPNGDTTRAMVVTMLWRMEGEPKATGTNPFSDVEAGTWYTDAVAWAAENKIVEGDGSRFAPNYPVVREQLATILYRYAQYKKADVSASASLSGYGDASGVSVWATDAMQWAVGSGIINGVDGKLLPQSNASRAQVATMLMRYSAAK